MKATLYRIVFGDYHKGKNHAETTLHTTAVEHKKHNEKHAKVEDCSRNDTHAANIQQRQRPHWQCLTMPGNAWQCLLLLCCMHMLQNHVQVRETRNSCMQRMHETVSCRRLTLSCCRECVNMTAHRRHAFAVQSGIP